jgi:hypothetical protein
VPEESDQPIADQIRGRLVPGEEEEDTGGVQLLLRQAVALLLGADERREQIVAGFLAPHCRDAAQVVRHLVDRPTGTLRAVHPAIEENADLVRPPLEQVAVLGRDAEQFRNDDCRQRVREGGDDVCLPAALHRIEQGIDDALDAPAQRLDHPRRKCLHHQTAQTRVVRRIAEHHPEVH